MLKITIPLLAMALCPLAASAQEQRSITMVALYKVKPGRMGEFLSAAGKVIAPVLDKLVADGVIQAYGLDTDVLHEAHEPNVAGWFNVTSYANLQKAEDAINAAQAAAPAESQVMLSAADMDAHRDMLLETVSAKFGKAAPMGAKPVTSIAVFKLRPGKGGDWMKAGDRYYKPTYDKLVADGVIYGYQVLQPVFHGADGDVRLVLVSHPDMAAMDKVDAAFAAAIKALSPAERSLMAGSMRDTTDEAAHRDYLMRAVFFKTR